MPEPGAASLGRSLLPRRPGCSLRRRLGTLPQFGEGDKLHKSCWPAPEGDALCRAHLTPRGAPGTSPQPRAQGPCRRPATRSARRRSVAPPPCPPPSLRSPLALVPTPRGNLKHGDPNGGFRLIDREKTRRPSRPFRRGLRGRPPHPVPKARGRFSGSARWPSRCCGAAAPGEGRSLGEGLGAPARRGWRPRARPGSRSGPAGSGFWRFGRPCGAEATISGAAPRALPPASGSSSAPRKRKTPFGSPGSRRQKSYLRWAESPGARGRVDGLGARPRRCAQEARAWGGSCRRGLLAAAPRPPAGGSEAPRSCGGGTLPETTQRTPTSS